MWPFKKDRNKNNVNDKNNADEKKKDKDYCINPKICKYIDDRLVPQQKWYEGKASQNKRMYIRNQKVVLILGASIPLIVVIEQLLQKIYKTNFNYASIISAFISAVITVFAGIDKLNQPQTNWFNFRANEETLKKEKWMYKFRTGAYRSLKEGEAERLLVENVEGIISADIARLNKTEQKDKDTDKEKDKEKDKNKENNNKKPETETPNQ